MTRIVIRKGDERLVVRTVREISGLSDPYTPATGTFTVKGETKVEEGLAAWDETPPASQPSKIAKPTGGSPIDSEARAAIDAIIDVLEGAGLSSKT
jgi:hypothetical protein